MRLWISPSLHKALDQGQAYSTQQMFNRWGTLQMFRTLNRWNAIRARYRFLAFCPKSYQASPVTLNISRLRELRNAPAPLLID